VPASTPGQNRNAPPDRQAGRSPTRRKARPQDVLAGRLIENIPRRMRAAKPERIEVRISREDTQKIIHGMEGRGEPIRHDVLVTQTMRDGAMRLTALDIREQQFRRVMRGFDPDEVVTFLGAVASEYELLVAENRDLRQRLLDLEHQIAEFQNMEKALRDTLLTAERVTVETRENAQKEAALILREAEMTAQQATSGISAEILQKRRELSELRQRKKDYLFSVRALAQSHLQSIDSIAQSVEREDTDGHTAAPGNKAPSVASAAQGRLETDSLPTFPRSGDRAQLSDRPLSSDRPLPRDREGVIPSAVARPGVEDRPLADTAPGRQPVAVEPGGSATPRHAGSHAGRSPEPAWAEAAFEPEDLVPSSATSGALSRREAEHFRRGIMPGDPLPSLLKASGVDDDTAGVGYIERAADSNPAHAVRPDGSPRD
jgi:cell division initiation protein